MDPNASSSQKLVEYAGGADQPETGSEHGNPTESRIIPSTGLPVAYTHPFPVPVAGDFGPSFHVLLSKRRLSHRVLTRFGNERHVMPVKLSEIELCLL